MDLERARKLKIGSLVGCPADRGDPAYTGKVTWHNIDMKNQEASMTATGTKFIWVEVQGPSHKAVWSSNRLG